MGDLVLTYYFVLRSVLAAKPDVRPCLTRCRYCGIFFFTHRRNRRRRDLGCPFGCREAHGKRRSNQRSTAYYATPEGKFKKKLQNDKRRKLRSKPHAGQESSAEPRTSEIEFDGEMVEHVRMVTSLIEGRPVSRDEVLDMLRRTVRQHRMAREKRIDYVVRSLRERPP